MLALFYTPLHKDHKCICLLIKTCVSLFSKLLNCVNDKTLRRFLLCGAVFSGIILAILVFETVSKTYLKNPRELEIDL
jgi:hypothetical protein